MQDSIPPYRETKRKEKKPNRWAVGFILLFFVSTLVLLFFQSPLSKVQRIEIEGNVTLKDDDILNEIALKPGVQFFQWDREAMRLKLLQEPQVKDVTITKSFPGKVVIDIEESPRVALWMPSKRSRADEFYPVLANGVILKQPWTGKVDKPLLRDWTDAGRVKEISRELVKVKPVILRSLSEIHLRPNGTYRDRVQVFTAEGNEVWTRISTFHDNINQYRKFVASGKKGIVHMTYGKDFGWFEPYVPEEKGKQQKAGEERPSADRH